MVTPQIRRIGEVFSGEPPSQLAVISLPPRHHHRKRAVARYGVEYDEEHDTYVVTLGRVSEELESLAGYLAYQALYEAPARALVPGARKLLRRYHRDGVAVLRAVARERKRSGLTEQLAAEERIRRLFRPEWC